MIKKKKEIKKDLEKHSEQIIHNEQSFLVVMKNFRPDIYVLMDLLDNTGINSYIIFHVIKHLNNILLGTKYGNVTISIEDGIVTFVRGEETTKLNERLKRV